MVTFQGDLYRGDIGRLAPSITVIGRPGPAGRLRVGVSGGNVLARWRRTLAQDSDLQLRVYYDRTHRNDPSYVDDLHTFDADFQHRLSVASRHEVTWSGSYRLTANQNESGGIFAVDPAYSRDQLFSGFIQDQIRLGDSLRVTLGTKVEHNDFSGAELQPSGRVAWDVRPAHTVWGAVSRAVRVPTRFERDIAVDVTDPAASPIIRLLGNPDFDAEQLLAYEGGYRWQALAGLSIDLAAFHNRYEGLASLEFFEPFLDPDSGRPVIPLHNENLTDGPCSRRRGARHVRADSSAPAVDELLPSPPPSLS